MNEYIDIYAKFFNFDRINVEIRGLSSGKCLLPNDNLSEYDLKKKISTYSIRGILFL